MKSRITSQLRPALIAGAAIVVLLSGGVIYAVNRPSEPDIADKAASAEHAHEEGEADHAQEERVVDLTAAQLQASGITVVGLSRGGGAESRIAGRVAPMVDARAAVAARVGGTVERVLVAPGQSVRPGQTLAVLVSGEAAAYRADVDAATASAEAARLAHDRDRNLFDQGVVARQEVESSRARALGAEAAVRAARARAQASGNPNAQGRLNIVSPISGVVTSVGVGPGGFVAQGGVVAEITDPARVELVFNAAPTLAAETRVGSTLRVSGPAGEFNAIVTGVATGAESGSTIIRAGPIGAHMPPAGAAVSGAIITGGAGALTAPSEAVQTIEGRSVVFVQTEHGFRATPVLTGRQASGRTEILRGLAGTERIAAAGAFLLKAELAKGEAGHDH